jgi:hypothetical protein
VSTRLASRNLSTYGLSGLALGPCCAFFSGEDPYFILCSYHEGYVDGANAARSSAEAAAVEAPPIGAFA